MNDITLGGPVDVTHAPSAGVLLALLPEKLVEPKDGLCRPRLLPMHPPTKGSWSHIVNHFSSKEKRKQNPGTIAIRA